MEMVPIGSYISGAKPNTQLFPLSFLGNLSVPNILYWCNLHQKFYSIRLLLLLLCCLVVLLAFLGVGIAAAASHIWQRGIVSLLYGALPDNIGSHAAEKNYSKITSAAWTTSRDFGGCKLQSRLFRRDIPNCLTATFLRCNNENFDLPPKCTF